ncbi:hypothetical protein M0805_008623 [Coniferiporia weirii]|nr:hypothetical protein M0805_008623 [Coniferiporia weirii]
MQTPQVLIVGSGPAGLALALSLLKNGIPARIIEKDAQHHNSERGAGVTPRTLEVEHFLGVGEEVRNSGFEWPTQVIFDPNDSHRIIKSAKFVEYVEPTPTFPITQGVMIGQWRHQAILRKHVEALGGGVELGSTLVGIQQNDTNATAEIKKTINGREVTERAEFAFIVGADGASSSVRKLCNIDFVGETHEEVKVFLADATMEGLEGERKSYFWGDKKKAVASARHAADPQIYQILIGGQEADLTSLRVDNSEEAVQKEFHRITGRTDLTIKDITWRGEWRPNTRMAEKFRDGRVFIIGDAAHAHPPMGGQGLNTSIQDAFNLAWKLALVLKGQGPPALLDSFEAERLPVIAEMLKITTNLYTKVVNEDAQHALGQAETLTSASATASGKATPWLRSRKLFQLELNYRWSSVVFDERYEGVAGADGNVYGVSGQDTRAGDRAPDAPELTVLNTNDAKNAPTRLFDVFSPSKHTVLVFASTHSAGKTQAMLDPFKALIPGLVHAVLILPPQSSFDASMRSAEVEYVYEDTKGHAYGGYGLSTEDGTPTVVIVRPDGMVGAFARTVAGVEKYLTAIFGSA